LLLISLLIIIVNSF